MWPAQMALLQKANTCVNTTGHCIILCINVEAFFMAGSGIMQFYKHKDLIYVLTLRIYNNYSLGPKF